MLDSGGWAVDRCRRHPRFVLGAVVFAIVAVAAVLVDVRVAFLALDRLVDRPLLFGGFLVGFALVRPLMAWPTSLIPIAAGYAFGVAGIVPSVILLTVTGVPPYWFARRTSGGGRVSRAGRRLLAATGGFRGVAASRLFPAPSDVVSIGAGIAGVRLRPYVLGTAVGEIPWAVLGVSVGVSIDRLVAGAAAGAFDPWVVVGMAAIGLLVLSGPLYRHFGPGPVAGPSES
ncbi:MAG: TVP38/TMEM64 family protein [Halobacteriota archaeon]